MRGIGRNWGREPISPVAIGEETLSGWQGERQRSKRAKNKLKIYIILKRSYVELVEVPYGTVICFYGSLKLNILEDTM